MKTNKTQNDMLNNLNLYYILNTFKGFWYVYKIIELPFSCRKFYRMMLNEGGI